MSREERLKAYDEKLDYLKPDIDCLKGNYCLGCEDEKNCKTISVRKKMGIPNPWERAWLDRKVKRSS